MAVRQDEKTMRKETKATGRTDVLIVGAGPTGLTLAYQLKRLGVDFRIVDKNPEPSTTSKAIGLQYRVSEVLAWMGLAERFLARSATSQKVNMYVGGERILQLKLSVLDMRGGQDAFVPRMMIIPQSETEALLIGALEEHGGHIERGTVFLGFEQNRDRVVSRLRYPDGSEERIESRYLVSCEGAHSIVRKQSGISFAGETYPFSFVMADVELDWDRSHDEIYSWLHEKGTLSAGPLPGNRWRLFIEMEEGQRVPCVTLELAQRLLAERTGDYKTHATNPTWLSEFRINSRMVDRFREGRVFLAGDAAHVHSPSGGQGITTGMQDAYNLSWKLAQVLNEGAPDSLLDTYSEERLPIVRSVLETTDRNTGILFPRGRFGRLIRNAVVLPLLRRDRVQDRLVRKMSQLDMNYRGASLSVDQNADGLLPRLRRPKTRVRAGDRTPDVVFRDAQTGGRTSLFTLLGRSRPLVLIGSGRTTERTTSITDLVQTLDRLGVDCRLVTPHQAGVEPLLADRSLIDIHEDFGRLYSSGDEFLYFIRPDGYVGLFERSIDAQALRGYLKKLFSADDVDDAFSLPDAGRALDPTSQMGAVLVGSRRPEARTASDEQENAMTKKPTLDPDR